MAMDMNVALKINAGVTGQQAVDQLRTSMDKLNGAASTVSGGFKAAGMALQGFLAIQAVQFIGNMASQLLNTADELQKMSVRTGESVESLSALKYAAELSGASIEEVQAAMGRLSAKAVDAATGNKEAALAFKALNVEVKNADGSMRSSLSIMADVGDSLGEITDATVRTAVAREIFGRNADALIPFLLTMKETTAEAQSMGAVLSGQFAADAEAFNDQVTRLTFQLQGMGNTILAELLPIMQTLTQSWIETGKQGGALGIVTEGIAIAMEALIVVGGNVVYVFKQIGNEAIGIGKQLAALATLDFSAFNSIGEQMRVDAENARKEIDAWSESILNARKEAAKPLPMPSTNGGTNQRAADVLKQLEAGRRQLTDAEKEAQRQEQQRKQLLQGLNDEITKMVQGEDELFIAKLRALGASSQEIAQAEQQLRQKAQLRAADRELEEASKEQARLDDDAKRKKDALADAGKRLFEETRTPAEKLNMELSRLNDLLAKGAIDWETYSRAVFNAQDEFEGVKDTGKDAMDELKSAIEGWGNQATDAFVEFAFTGKSSFKDMVNSILQDIARMVIQKTIMAPLMSSIGSMFGFADGGIMTASGPVPLQKYASGGVANSPQLALFGEGAKPEAYVPLPDGRTIPVTMTGASGGNTSVVVNVSVEGGAEQVTQDQGAGELGRLIAASVKAELINQKRPGGLLAA